VDRHAGEQRQVGDLDAAGHRDLEAEVGQPAHLVEVAGLPAQVAEGLAVAAAVGDDLLDAERAPIGRLRPGPAVDELELDVALALPRLLEDHLHGGRVAPLTTVTQSAPASKASLAMMLPASAMRTSAKQHLVGVERAQGAHGVHALRVTEDGAGLDDVDVGLARLCMGASADGEVEGVERELQHGAVHGVLSASTWPVTAAVAGAVRRRPSP
jgi:hypothetical protein